MREPSYNEREALKFAISMEEEGVVFYETLAQKATGEIKQALLNLAEDEKNHAKTFQGFYDQLELAKQADEYLFEESITAFFRSYAKSKGFEKRQEVPDSLKEAIEMAMETEKITIDYYENLQRHANSSVAKVLQNLINEEKGHYAKLNKYKESLV